MIVHVGLAALLAALAAWVLLRGGRRQAAGVVLGAAALAAAVLEIGLAVREAGVRSRWDDLASAELSARSDRIVQFLRDEGSDALGAIRRIAADPDTRALLSPEEGLSRTARRPVFLDLMDRFPSRGTGGVTVYDAGGAPRAWSGWSATATMSLAAEPSRASEVIEIREGNIYTVLQVTHPVVVPDAAPAERADPEAQRVLGYVVYQEPLRVQFPLENRFLQVDDVLQRLEGGGGIRADVALALEVARGDDIRSIRPGAPKLDVRGDVASASAAILAGGNTVGRVSLVGLSREQVVAERTAGLSTLRDWLLLAVVLLLAARAWTRTDRGGIGSLLIRAGLVVAVRAAFQYGVPRGSDLWGLFDPSVYALTRFGGLLRSPGDLLLTAAAFLLIGREVRRFFVVHRERMQAFARRRPGLSLLPGAAAALFVGSFVGLHWARTVNVARDANVALYGGLDPFSSVPAAALELALLLGGAGLLFFGDALVTAAGSLFARIPARIAAPVVWGLAALGSAVKVGTAADEASLGQATTAMDSDLLRMAVALAALFAFHRLSRAWNRPGAGAILGVAVLAAVTNYTALLEAGDMRRRSLVELYAHDHVESPSNYRHFFLESMIDFFGGSEELPARLAEDTGPEQANLAFILWARSPLASVSAGCRLRILDDRGSPVSTFSLGFPPELIRNFDSRASLDRYPVQFRREEIGATRVDVYSGNAPLSRNGRRVGAIELAMAYFDDLRSPGPVLPSVFTNLTTPDDFQRPGQERPDRIDRYRGDVLVYSTDPEGGLGKRVPSFLVQALEEDRAQGRWVERLIGDRLWDLYCVRERNGDFTVGYLTFGIERRGPLESAGLLVRTVLVGLVLSVLSILLLMAFAWVVPVAGSRRLRLPRLGFRERVIAGFLLVALLPTVLLGFAGRRLFVEEKRQEFQQRLEEDLRLSRELIGRRLADAARNAAGSEEILACLRDATSHRVLSRPRSVDGIVVVADDGTLLGSSRAADLGMAIVPGQIPAPDAPLEFFRRRGRDLYSCAVVPVPAQPALGLERGGSVLAFQRIDAVLAADLERRVGSAVSLFTGGLLVATSKPELYQAEILSDLAESEAYLKIELEGARRTVLESRVGSTSFLASYAPLADENGDAVGILSTLAAFRGGGLDREAATVLSRIYFVCLAVFAGAIAAAVVLASRLTRPISDLTLGAERIGAGNLGHVIATRASGEIGALVRSFNSMSRRLEASEARDRERREYIEAIIRHVGSGVVSFDAEGRIATVNEAASRILVTDAASLIGKGAAEAEGTPALTALFAAAEPLLAGVRPEVVSEIEVPSPGDEELHSIRLVGTPLVGPDGAPQGAVVVFEDLTDLIKSKKIKAWAEMARQVAHEIKNPLTPMKLSAQQMLQAWKDQHPRFDEILQESAETIVDRCEALRRIAVEFSDYARMPGRRIKREDLGGLLREARRLYGLDDRNVEFTLDAPERELYTRVDKDEVMRLFINLIENSIQAMPAGGKLDVSAWGRNGSAHVAIRDTGAGITRENLARIFEPSFSTKTGGAGLGLPICKAIMEDYGGTIDIQSTPGDGTTVTLVFPSES